VNETIVTWLVSGQSLKVAKFDGLPFIHQEILQRVLQNTGLHTISVAKCEAIRGRDLSSISNCADLSVLNISGTKVDDVCLGFIAKCVKLSHLYARDCKGLSDKGVRELRGLTELVVLTLNGGLVTDASVPILSEFQKLRYLVIGAGISQAGRGRIREHLPKCQIEVAVAR
jgi:hypothetical protein